MMRKDKVAESISTNAKASTSVKTPPEYIKMLDEFVEEQLEKLKEGMK